MRRFHVNLTERQYEFLSFEAYVSGLTRGELVRRALEHTYPLRERPRVGGIELNVGLFRDPDAAIVGRRLRRRFTLRRGAAG